MKEVIEICPECSKENFWIGLDPIACNYTAICQHCGAEMMLCDECLNAKDNPYQKCDWHECKGCKNGTCFRNQRKHRIAE